MNLTVTVLIPAHNEAEHIDATVRAALQQTYPPLAVLVVDDRSADDTAELARAAGATVVAADCGRKAGAQNVGLAHVETDIIVGVDADTQLAPDAIELMVASLERGFDGTCATVLPQQPKGLYVRARRFEYALARTWWKWAQAQVGRVYVLSGCGFAIRTEAIRAIGGFSDRHISEDTHTTWQLYRAGFKLTYTAKAVSYSHEPETFASYYGQVRRWAAGSFQVMAEYWREFRKPAVLLVVGTSLFDLIMLPTTYLGALWLGARSSGFRQTLLLSMTVWFIATYVLAARVIGLREAAVCFLPHKVVSPINRFVYAWSMVRELILGRHYASWTGRQGRGTVITPMTRQRRIGLAGTSAGLAALSLGVWLIHPGVPEGPTVALRQVPRLPPVIPPAATITPASGELEKVVVPAAVTQPAATAPNPLPAPATPPVVSARRTLPSTMRQPATTSTSLLAAPEDALVAATEGAPPVAPTGQQVPPEAEPTATTVPAVSSPEEAEREDEPEEARRAKQERRGAESDLAKDILKEAERRHGERKGANGGEDEVTEQMPERSQG